MGFLRLEIFINFLLVVLCIDKSTKIDRQEKLTVTTYDHISLINNIVQY